MSFRDAIQEALRTLRLQWVRALLTLFGIVWGTASVECLGFLLGYKLEDRLIIEHAFTAQSANRRHKGVVYNRKNHKRIEPILARFDKLQIIGDFHSHTQFGLVKGLPIPSPEDIKEMLLGQVYLILQSTTTRRQFHGVKIEMGQAQAL